MPLVLLLLGWTQKWLAVHIIIPIGGWSSQMDASAPGKVFDSYQKKNIAAERDRPGVVDVRTFEIQVTNVDERIALPAVNDVYTVTFREPVPASNNHTQQLQQALI